MISPLHFLYLQRNWLKITSLIIFVAMLMTILYAIVTCVVCILVGVARLLRPWDIFLDLLC